MLHFLLQSNSSGTSNLPEQFVSRPSTIVIPPLIPLSCSDIMENLAWAACQIHCYCNSTISPPEAPNPSGNNSQSRPTQPDSLPSLNDTSIAAAMKGQGQVVLKTEPKILFCDLRLAPGETKSYLFKEPLPLSSPPSYKGTYIKYSYKITITAARLNSNVQVLRVPIRVLPMPTLIKPDEVPALCNETNEELAPTNPFLEKKSTESKLEIALHHLQNITARRRPNFYLISNKRGVVGRFCLFKPAYKLGEDIVGTLDFSCGVVSCVQYSVTLRCEEILYKVPESAVAKTKAIAFNKHHEMCLGLSQTQMILPVPLHITPTFATDRSEIRWQLHFQFVTTTAENLMARSSEEANWRAPTDIDIETMIWNLPITLYPTSPHLIQQPANKYKLVIK